MTRGVPRDPKGWSLGWSLGGLDEVEPWLWLDLFNRLEEVQDFRGYPSACLVNPIRCRLTPGQTFYEHPDDLRIVGRNASSTKLAKFLVFLIKDKGAPVLVPVE